MAENPWHGGRRHQLAPSDRRQLERGRSLRLNLIVAVSAAVINPAPVDAGFGATAPSTTLYESIKKTELLSISFSDCEIVSLATCMRLWKSPSMSVASDMLPPSSFSWRST